ncbi:tRNA pseudouridine synthase A [Pauljensenia sp. UMB0895]|uniref:tRNA pseudouridine synthase A n=1 Tax=Pauljensenia sp. UMB0895 TaxID=3046319 RepID=UPI00254E3C32|nr:tRNA pseudouridine synthase A [Pauljensenia sp. UMB0895]MDK7337524.1 tRNA pseudouridine synthase A [Pauljensenia sp. UMB0895]
MVSMSNSDPLAFTALVHEPVALVEESAALVQAPHTLRIRLDLSYDGTNFHGWASQPGQRTVQGEIEAGLGLVLRCPTVLTVAGRTDAGVHARHQVVHFDVEQARWEKVAPRGAEATAEACANALVRRLNGVIARAYGQWMRDRALNAPKGTADVVIREAHVVSSDFDARFSALGRHYCYRLMSGGVDPLRRFDVLSLEQPLDVDLMNRAAAPLLGEHDFLSYCRPREGATTIRALTRLEFKPSSTALAHRSGALVHRSGALTPQQGVSESVLVECFVDADAFCHSMVRSLVGALVEVGLGRRSVDWPYELLQACSRTSAAPIAPAHGLTLEGVDYPAPDQWASRAQQARSRRDSCCGDGS